MTPSPRASPHTWTLLRGALAVPAPTTGPTTDDGADARFDRSRVHRTAQRTRPTGPDAP
ncbi:hypothetical protein [Streptomyces beihaiensis]|uniref:Uncharacterized protein n=1 Tax=Streptomyces beihaiensis TaxID=2984495 RepID=A0ABT3TVZ1_9ACTN|nr:hypothetical protein [Streptomyces beihaiensis]MCX3061222.1 hypothetical protein [Streptomyces beihaiensis]